MRNGTPDAFAAMSSEVPSDDGAATGGAGSRGDSAGGAGARDGDARCLRVALLDYGAGNVRSIRNALEAASVGVTEALSVRVELCDVKDAADLAAGAVDAVVFPGVGSFGSAMEALSARGLVEPLKAYLASDRPFFGVCLGMQTLFESSAESPGVEGLGVVPGDVGRFDVASAGLSVPHVGWNGARIVCKGESPVACIDPATRVFFVHSFRVVPSESNAEWVAATTDYGGPFVSAVQKGNVCATQFHPEKSGAAGIAVLASFLTMAARAVGKAPAAAADATARAAPAAETSLARRVIAGLDVRTNDDGDLVVTKGDQYDVRDDGGSGAVRNLGKPVELAARYYEEGADEVVFLNICAFRGEPLEDLPMLRVLEEASKRVYVPLTIGGGIRTYTDAKGREWPAMDVAARYFRAGADKVSIGSDAVYAAEDYYARGETTDGSTAIEQISHRYGAQAVVVSIDPRRVYVSDPTADDVAGLHVIETEVPGPAGERHCWYQCTVRGGREGRRLDAWHLARAVEALGAGELLVNCVDRDGQKSGFDTELLKDVCSAVSIPVIASSGAGSEQHFVDVFQATRCEAALAAGIFHRREVPIRDVKRALRAADLPVRVTADADA